VARAAGDEPRRAGGIDARVARTTRGRPRDRSSLGRRCSCASGIGSLTARGKHVNQVVVVTAREMAAFVGAIARFFTEPDAALVRRVEKLRLARRRTPRSMRSPLSSLAPALRYPATSKRSDSGGLDHRASAPLIATARSGLARQAS